MLKCSMVKNLSKYRKWLFTLLVIIFKCQSWLKNEKSRDP